MGIEKITLLQEYSKQGIIGGGYRIACTRESSGGGGWDLACPELCRDVRGLLAKTRAFPVSMI